MVTRMGKKTAFTASTLAALVALLTCLPPVARTRAQDFGSSLKRPKADGSGRPGKDVAPRGAGEEPAEEVVRVDTSLVLLDVLVADRSGETFVAGLKSHDFVVTEDGREQEISFFALGDDARLLPRSIVLVLDRSDSQLPYLEASVEAAKKLVGQLAPSDEMAIVTDRSEEHTSELQSLAYLVCRLLLEKKNKNKKN